MDFKWFIINEEKAYLGHQIGDVLTSVQNLEQDLGGMGIRQIARISDDIVNQIRKILHAQWSPRQMKYLKDLQKVAVALKKAVEEKDDLKEIIPQLSQAIQAVSKKLNVKTNDIQGPEQGGSPALPPDMQLTGNGPKPPQPAGGPPGPQPPTGSAMPPVPGAPPA